VATEEGWVQGMNDETEKEQTILLTQIDTKLTILLDNFDKHCEDDRHNFEKHDNRLKAMERVHWMWGGVVIFFTWLFRGAK